jgi:GDPmannose 4,6-dehydratase
MTTARRALITGITGQDGSYLAELLLSKGYRVTGLARRTSHDAFERIRHLKDRVTLLECDLTDQASVDAAVAETRPHELYNLAAQSFVPSSWRQPVLTGDVTALGAARLLEAVRRLSPETRFYQASSSEMFGAVGEAPQKETTRFYPRSPYGCAKAYAHHMTVNYRESFGLYAAAGICFNHESPRRGLDFVTRKATRAAAAISLGLARELRVGNLEAERDWGFAGDYVEAMWRMLQQPRPDDYVIATGRAHSVRRLLELAFGLVKLDWKKHVKVDRRLLRPAEVGPLRGDASKARRALDWRPKVSFEKLVEMMVEADLESLRRERAHAA